jgi:hypothetical protein
MSKLWVFGDSFVVERNKHYNFSNSVDWAWHKQIAKKLKCSEIRVVGEFGISNEFLMHLIMQNKHLISKNDYVIIITTQIGRQWLLEDHPQYSNIAGLYHSPKIQKKGLFRLSKQQNKALVDYYKVIYPDNSVTLGHLFLEAFLCWIGCQAEIFNWGQTFVMSGFESQQLHHTQVSLYDLELTEFVDHDTKQFFLDQGGGVDRRIMHLSKRSHDWLADKILEWFDTRWKPDVDWTLPDVEPLFSDKQSVLDWQGIGEYETIELPEKPNMYLRIPLV